VGEELKIVGEANSDAGENPVIFETAFMSIASVMVGKDGIVRATSSDGASCVKVDCR
jgi:hypothetical protein